MVTTFQYTTLQFLARLYEIEERLISQPGDVRIEKVWHYIPDQSLSITDTPAILNGLNFEGEARHSALGIETYTVPIQIIHRGAERNLAADILIGFHDAFITALGGDLQLGGTVTIQEIAGANPTLGTVVYGNDVFIALQYRLSIRIEKARDYE